MSIYKKGDINIDFVWYIGNEKRLKLKKHVTGGGPPVKLTFAEQLYINLTDDSIVSHGIDGGVESTPSCSTATTGEIL